MKRYIVTLLMAVMIVMGMNASSLKVISGSLDVLKEQANATYELDFSNTRWEKKQDFKSWCGEDYNTRIESMNTEFKTSFNNFSKGLQIADTTPKYEVVFCVDNFERKQGMGMWGSCYIKVYGTINVINLSDNSTALSVEVKGQGGDTDFVENDRFPKTIFSLCKELFKIKK